MIIDTASAFFHYVVRYDTLTEMNMWLKKCNYYPDHVGLITIEDKHAEKLPDGSWKCGECVTTDIRSMVRVLGADHPTCREFVREEQRQVDRWNQFSKIVNHVCTAEVMKKEKNRYL